MKGVFEQAKKLDDKAIGILITYKSPKLAEFARKIEVILTTKYVFRIKQIKDLIPVSELFCDIEVAIDWIRSELQIDSHILPAYVYTLVKEYLEELVDFIKKWRPLYNAFIRKRTDIETNVQMQFEKWDELQKDFKEKVHDNTKKFLEILEVLQ